MSANNRAAGVSGRSWLYMASGIGIGALFLYLTVRNVDLNEAMATLAGMNPAWLVPVTLVYTLNLMLRCWRWQLLFPDDERPSLRFTTDAYMIGRLANNVMPGKLGEVIRAAALGRFLPKVGITGALATVVVEKIFDALIVAVMLGLAVQLAPLPDWISRAGLIMVIVFGAIFIAFTALDRSRHRIADVAAPSPQSHWRARIAHWIRGAMQRFATGLYAIRHAQHFTLLSVMTVGIWLLEGLVLYICLVAFAISAPPAAALVTLVFLCAGSMLPSAPGFIGSYQLFIVSALQLYNVPETSAFAMAVFVNIFIIVLTTVLGVAAIVMEGGMVNLRQLLADARNSAAG